ncbi:K02A2.6-like [Cordylochernes scorpioides]|uniref:RNA-directed DNA polymerase n=1 Tax=Cordylochernes scorpioides TaxID=51811 RepID=A0ABY6JZ28_9ARAC|nr:K02A2.6-like [Cordylochernes scorpioides]
MKEGPAEPRSLEDLPKNYGEEIVKDFKYSQGKVVNGYRYLVAGDVGEKKRTKLRGGLQSSCCLKRSDCCLPPTPVYFLEVSRKFYELLSPVLLLLSLTVLQLLSKLKIKKLARLFKLKTRLCKLKIKKLARLTKLKTEKDRETIEAQNQAHQTQHQELKESLGLKFQSLEDEISAVREDVSSVKEDISSVKQEMKEKMASLKERIGCCRNGPSKNSVPTFDGQSSWTSFKTQFDVVSQANGWNVRDKASFLAAALRGPAVDVLQMIPEQLRLDFNALIDALESRYGEEHYQKLQVVSFKNRLQDKKESLQDLANDIRLLERLAFPTCPSETQDFMAQQRHEALTAQQASRGSYRVARQVKLDNPEREKGRCWTCGANDHLSPTCPRKEEPGKLRIVSFSGRKLTGSFGNAPGGTFQVSSLRNTENGFLLRGFINGRSCDMVIDTGANVTLVRADVFQNLIQIGSKIFQYKGYVADIMDECIIGLDVLRQFGLSIDIGRKLLRTSDEDIPLLTSQQLHNFQTCRVLALEDTQVPPRSECVIKGQLETTKVIPKNAILEGDSEAPSKGILVVKELIDTGQDVIPVRVVNLYDSARAIKKGSCLGNAEPAVLIKRNHPVMQKSKRADNVPDHLQQVWEETKKELQPGQQKELATLLATYGNIFSNKAYNQHWKLNDITKKDSYPFPRIDATLDTLAGSQWFSTLDLKSGYWQVEMHPDDKEKTAFTTGSGLWQFNVMPIGLCNAPATFERLKEAVLQGLATETCLVYLDDIIKVFKRLEAANLKLSPKKCKLFKKELAFLGHIISAEGVQTDPEKTETVRMWPTPEDLTQLRSFLGLCTYYRRLIPGFSKIARPLHRLTEMQEGSERVIAYFSKTLSKPERNYCVTRKELLAIFKSIEHFHHYLYGQEFILRSDHASLQWLLNFKNPEGQLARWIQRLQEYQVKIQHRPGKRHQNAHALSRRPCVSQCGHCARAEEKYGVRQRDGVLYRKWESEDGKHEFWKLVLPRSHVPLALQEMHSSPTGCHFGIRKTLPKLEKDIFGQKVELMSENGAEIIYNVGAPFERIAIDVVGPFPKSDLGNKYILVIMDYFTKWPVAVPIPDQEASTVSEALLQDWVSIFELCRRLGIEKTRTTPLHPQSDGMVERFNRTLTQHLTMFIDKNQRDWDQHLPMLLWLIDQMSMNRLAIALLECYLAMNSECLVMCSLVWVREKLHFSSEKMKDRYNVKTSHKTFKEGEMVWLHNPQRNKGLSPKLQYQWEGPYKIIKCLNDVIYRIQKCNNIFDSIFEMLFQLLLFVLL